jgi:pseudomonalisin
MKRAFGLALVTGLITASCSHGGGSSALPPMSPQMQSSTVGAGTVHTSALAAAPAGWANTNTQAYVLPSGGSDLGAAPSTQSVTVRVGMQMRNTTQLQQLVANEAIVDDATLASTYLPTSTQVSNVTAYLRNQGFSNIIVEPNNLLISATGTVATANKAFDTSIHKVSVNGQTAIANMTPAYVPTSLGGTVVAVLGLNNIQSMAPKPQVTSCSVFGVGTPDAGCLRFYDPATFNVTYDTGSTPDASITNVAIMTTNDLTNAISFFRQNETQFHLAQVPISIVQVGLHTPENTTATDEWNLDMTYSTGMAGKVKTLYLYNTSSLTDSDVTLMFNHWVTDNKAPVANASFGGCELFPFLDGSMLVGDEIFLEGAAHGQTMFSSTGDTGSFCSVGVPPNGVPGGAPFVEYPAASQYVVAVGGTDLFSNADGTYKGEQSWEAGGGGLSQFESAPYWEQFAQPVAQNANFRGVPDIAFDASLETGALLWGGTAANGGCTPCVTGGTSLSSPMAVGVWARLQSFHSNRLGFAAPRLYRVYQKYFASATPVAGPPPTQSYRGFHDILSGGNGAFTALPGYDYTTGLGSFDIRPLNGIIGGV